MTDMVASWKKPQLCLIVFLLLMGSFPVLPLAFSAQPPVDSATYYVGTIGQPRRLDPSRAYDTASGEVIQNIYQPLVFFSDKPVAPSYSTNITADYVADVTLFEPLLATALPTISPDGREWVFTIRSNVPFHPWIAANGDTYSGANNTLTAADVEYSIERMLVQDCFGGPSWMFALPGTGYAFYDAFDADTSTNTIDPPANEAALGTLIEDFVTTSGNTVTFHWAWSWSSTALYQIFAQTWGCVGSKAFCIEHGCWDDSFAPGWSTSYRRKPSNSYTPLDQYYAAKSRYSSGTGPNTGTGGDVPCMCGTGPYKFTSWDKANKIWRYDAFDDYWKGWTGAAGGIGTPISTVIERGIDNWLTRETLFLSGEVDVCAVPRANMFDILDPFTSDPAHTPISGIRLYWDIPMLSNEVASFVFDVAPESPYQSKILGTTVSDFFSYEGIRRAFCQALNFSAYLSDVWFNEAIQPATWWVQGLEPASYEDTSIPRYSLNMGEIVAELSSVYPPEGGGQSVWETGFETYLVYDLGNDQRKIACDMIAETFASLWPGKYKVNVVGVDLPLYLDYMGEFYLPVFFADWLADFAHPDNFARPYMYSQGDIAYLQGYGNSTIDFLIDDAITQTNTTIAEQEYKQLQQIYHYDALGLPLTQPLGRRWARDWVEGWYYNPLYPGLYAYDLYKVAVSLEPVDVEVVSITPVPPTYSEVLVYDGEMRIGYGNPNLAWIGYTVVVRRNDLNANVALLRVSVSLKRTNLANSTFEYVSVTHIWLASEEAETLTLTWYEDGENLAITVGSWQVCCEAYPEAGAGIDSDTANNKMTDGTVEAKALPGDANGDGVVDIYDAILLANSFLKRKGENGYNPKVDLDENGVVDIFDAIRMAGNFLRRVGQALLPFVARRDLLLGRARMIDDALVQEALDQLQHANGGTIQDGGDLGEGVTGTTSWWWDGITTRIDTDDPGNGANDGHFYNPEDVDGDGDGDDADVINTIVHEARHVWQMHLGSLTLNEKNVNMDLDGDGKIDDKLVSNDADRDGLPTWVPPGKDFEGIQDTAPGNEDADALQRLEDDAYSFQERVPEDPWW